MSACCMCVGTDCAGECARGNCYAEYMQEMEALEAQYLQAEYDSFMDDASEASMAIGAFAEHFAKADRNAERQNNEDWSGPKDESGGPEGICPKGAAS